MCEKFRGSYTHRIPFFDASFILDNSRFLVYGLDFGVRRVLRFVGVPSAIQHFDIFPRAISVSVAESSPSAIPDEVYPTDCSICSRKTRFYFLNFTVFNDGIDCTASEGKKRMIPLYMNTYRGLVAQLVLRFNHQQMSS